MIDHVSIGVRDVAKTKRFYDAALKHWATSASARARTRSATGAKRWHCGSAPQSTRFRLP